VDPFRVPSRKKAKAALHRDYTFSSLQRALRLEAQTAGGGPSEPRCEKASGAVSMDLPVFVSRLFSLPTGIGRTVNSFPFFVFFCFFTSSLLSRESAPLLSSFFPFVTFCCFPSVDGGFFKEL